MFSKCIISGFIYITDCNIWFLQIQVCYHKSDHTTQSDYIPLCNILLRMYNKKHVSNEFEDLIMIQFLCCGW